jgi:Methyltransferase domain
VNYRGHLSTVKTIARDARQLARNRAAPAPSDDVAGEVAVAGPEPSLDWVPSGHFYSPILSLDERARATKARPIPHDIPGIDLREQAQLAFLKELLPYYKTLSFTADPNPASRYHYDNMFYSYSDAVHYALMLQRLGPRRVIEVGCGYSSALALDVVENSSEPWPVAFTFIEPFPEVLRHLARPGDLEGRLVECALQEVDVSTFSALEAGDFLFIDSTHVAKASSDVNYMIFEILPRLAVGVYIHMHDVFYPFEYPDEWIREGRSWNEAYVLRAFLQYNQDFEIVMFNTFMEEFHEDWYRANMPLCLKDPGGSIWLRRT